MRMARGQKETTSKKKNMKNLKSDPYGDRKRLDLMEKVKAIEKERRQLV